MSETQNVAFTIPEARLAIGKADGKGECKASYENYLLTPFNIDAFFVKA